MYARLVEWNTRCIQDAVFGSGFKSRSGYAGVSQLAEETGPNPVYVWFRIPPSALMEKREEVRNCSTQLFGIRKGKDYEAKTKAKHHKDFAPMV